MALNIVLIHPEIPQNTGNIARTCVVTDSVLHIVKPMGFSLDEKHVRRAGLDYWSELKLYLYENENDFFNKYADSDLWFFSSKVNRPFWTADFSSDSFLLFGSETKGLGEEFLTGRKDKSVRIPMSPNRRCLNLSNAVCVALYEALRQVGYRGLV